MNDIANESQVAIKDKMDLAIGVAIGSSLQIALLVLPLMVMFSWWGVGPGTLTLAFDGFQVSVLFIAIVLVNYLIQDGKSHWLEGEKIRFYPIETFTDSMQAYYSKSPTSSSPSQPGSTLHHPAPHDLILIVYYYTCLLQREKGAYST